MVTFTETEIQEILDSLPEAEVVISALREKDFIEITEPENTHK